MAIEQDSPVIVINQQGDSPTYTAGTGITIDAEKSISVTANTYADKVHTHTASAITSGLSTVATSGSYDDLTDQPAIHNVPAGGTAGQILTKSTNTNYDVDWADAPTGEGGTAYGAGTGITIDANNKISVTPNTYAADSHTHAYSAITGTPALSTVATSGSYNDLSNKPTIPSAYTLPTASASTLGGIKVGNNLSISSGTLSATNTTYSAATTTAAGLMSAADKTKLNGIAASANNYTLPAATTAALGGIKVGANLTVTADGTLSASSSGGGGTTYQAGAGIAISASNVISQSWPVVIPTPINADSSVFQIDAANFTRYDLTDFELSQLTVTLSSEFIACKIDFKTHSSELWAFTMSPSTDVGVKYAGDDCAGDGVFTPVTSAVYSWLLERRGSNIVIFVTRVTPTPTNTITVTGAGTKMVTALDGSVSKTSIQPAEELPRLGSGYIAGNTRGDGAVDLQMFRNAASQVAAAGSSVAMGSGNSIDARAMNAVTLGMDNIINDSADCAFAVGHENNVSASCAVAMGYNSIASGWCSVAMGYWAVASGGCSFAVGESAEATATGAIAIGRACTYATASHAVAVGSGSHAEATHAVALGGYATGYRATAIQDSFASGSHSVAIGESSTASGKCSIATGFMNYASGAYSVAIGLNNNASKTAAIAVGQYNSALAVNSILSGYGANGSVPGAVMNNTRPCSVNLRSNSSYGHAGFKGVHSHCAGNAPESATLEVNYGCLFAVNVTDVVIIRIQCIAYDVNKVGEALLVIRGSEITKNIQDSTLDAMTFTLDNGKLQLATIGGSITYDAQFGIWYTLYANQGSSGAGSGSFGAGSGSGS